MSDFLPGWQEYASPRDYDPNIIQPAAPVQTQGSRTIFGQIGDLAGAITPLIGGVEDIVRAARNLPARTTGSDAYRMAGSQLGEFLAAAQRAYEQGGGRAQSVVPSIEEEEEERKPTVNPLMQDKEALKLQSDLRGVLTPRLSVLFG